jgi:hypothetical protein
MKSFNTTIESKAQSIGIASGGFAVWLSAHDRSDLGDKWFFLRQRIYKLLSVMCSSLGDGKTSLWAERRSQSNAKGWLTAALSIVSEAISLSSLSCDDVFPCRCPRCCMKLALRFWRPLAKRNVRKDQASPYHNWWFSKILLPVEAQGKNGSPTPSTSLINTRWISKQQPVQCSKKTDLVNVLLHTSSRKHNFVWIAPTSNIRVTSSDEGTTYK